MSLSATADRKGLIFCASSWGQLGNLNSARRLASHLNERMEGWSFAVEPVEQHLPFVAEIGQQMRHLAKATQDPRERRERYKACIAQIAQDFPPGFERGGTARRGEAELGAFAGYIATAAPDLVIGTKGIVTRLADAASRQIGSAVPLVNYVTNDGLLGLPIHRTDRAVLNLVQTDFGLRSLGEGARGVRVGPLVGQVATKAPPDPDPSPLVAILCNRNPEYASLFAMLREAHPPVRVNAVIMGCDDLLEQVGRTAPASWEVHGEQAAKTYLDLIARVAASSCRLLVTKSAPSSVFEPVAVGVPVLAVKSGLPMEDWILDFIREYRLGWTADTIEEANSILGDLLQRPQAILEMAETALSFSQIHLNNAKTVQSIRQALTDELEWLSSNGEPR